MEMTVETTVTLHLKNDNYLKQKAGLTADTLQILHLLHGDDNDTSIVDRAAGAIQRGKSVIADTDTIKKAFDALHELVDEAVWTAIEAELETLEEK